MVKLNLGCGHKLMDGFINCDLYGNWSGKRPDIECDVTKRLPFEDEYADEIHAYHLLEHIQRWEAPNVLKDWMRSLKPGGKLVLEMPCLEKILNIFVYYMQKNEQIDPRLTMWGLYGDPRYKNDAMVHKWCWSSHELVSLLEALGYTDVQAVEPQTHISIRDMRIEARRPA